jgi:hypothetical protein
MGKKIILDSKDFWIDLHELHFLVLVCDLTCALTTGGETQYDQLQLRPGRSTCSLAPVFILASETSGLPMLSYRSF